MNLNQPEELSLPNRYKQAKALLSETSRATNPNWYADALAINLQLHIFVGSDSGAISYIRNTETGVWSKGPNISTEMEEDPALLKPVIDGIIKEHLAEAKHPALGVILYVADEFSTAELGPEHQNPADIEDLRQRINVDPRSVLEDQSISNESHAWRLFPYPGAESHQPFATAIAFTRRHEALLEELRKYGTENNLPLQTRAISAPLCAITALPWLLEQKPENGFVAIYHYPQFSVLSFFNIHGDLVLIRTLQHHGGSPFSPQTASAILSSTASLELENPHVFIIPMAGFPPMGMSDSLSSMLPNSQVITLSPTSSALHIPTAPSAANKGADMGVTRAWKWSDLTAQAALEKEPSQAEVPKSDSVIPGVTRPWKLQDMAAVAMLSQVRLEVVSTTNPPSASKSVLAESHTFKTLVDEMWPLQDFLPPSSNEKALYPDLLEMKTLKYSKFAKYAAIAAIAFVSAKAAVDIYSATQDPAWNYQSTNAQFELTQQNKDLSEYTNINTLLSDRSRVWSNMELLTQMTPKDSTIRIKNFSYNINVTPTNATAGKIPVIRTWNITGNAAASERSYINSLNSRAQIEKIFKAVFEATQDESFDTSNQKRPPISDVKTKITRRTRSQSNTNLPDQSLEFTMTIIQRLENTDPLTLPAAKN